VHAAAGQADREVAVGQDRQPARVLNMNAPGGWEVYLRDLARAVGSGTMPGTAEFARIVAKYDFVVPA